MSYPGSSAMRALVTGSSGFLGQALAKRLTSDGTNVTGIDLKDRPVKDQWSLQTAGTFEFVQADICDPAALDVLFSSNRFDEVYHLAAIASPRVCQKSPELARKVNVEGTQNLLTRLPITAHMTFVSSALVYGRDPPVPVAESAPTSASDVYSETKVRAEELCHAHNTHRPGQVTIVRNFNSYGPGQPDEYLVPTMLHQIFESGQIEPWNGETVRDYLYVDDAVGAFVLGGRQTRSEVINVGSGIGTSAANVARLLLKRANLPANCLADLHRRDISSSPLIADNRRLLSMGWVPKWSLEDGLGAAIGVYRGIGDT
jgi:nucleoside-diphosphate-sugar epimerase